ncbi:MAG: GerAB/ArcD/ProY family transporter [Bacillota bacterium]
MADNQANSSRLNPRQLSMLLMVFVFGDSMILLITRNDPQHNWIAYILAGIGGFLLLSSYLQIYKLNGKTPLTTICNNCFGRFAGSVLSILYALFLMADAALTVYNYDGFILLSNYIYSPRWFVIAVLGIITIYALFKGIRVIGRTAEIFVWIILLAFVFVNIFDAGAMKMDNINPIIPIDALPIVKDAFYPLILNYGGMVAFLMLFPLTADVNAIQKPLYAGTGIVTGVITLQMLRALMVLGGSMLGRYIFPIHQSFFIGYPVKLEIIPDSAISLSVLIKVIVLLYASIMILAKVFNTKKTSPFIIAVTLATFLMSNYIFTSSLAISEFLMDTWVYAVAVFAVAIPVLLLIISLIRNGIKRNKPVLSHKRSMRRRPETG